MVGPSELAVVWLSDRADPADAGLALFVVEGSVTSSAFARSMPRRDAIRFAIVSGIRFLSRASIMGVLIFSGMGAFANIALA